MTAASMTSSRVALLALVLAACGGGSATKPDLRAGATVDLQVPAGDLSVVEQPCVTKAECGAVSVCAYPIADGCTATGHCAPSPSSGCGAIAELCGCDGKIVQGGTCLYPPGTASGPTTGKSSGNCDSDAGS